MSVSASPMPLFSVGLGLVRGEGLDGEEGQEQQ